MTEVVNVVKLADQVVETKDLQENAMVDAKKHGKVDTQDEHVDESEKQKHRKKKFRFYDSYIPKILKHSYENNGITCDAKQQLNSILCIFSKKIADITIQLTDISGKRTLSAKEVSSATEIFLSGELKQHAVAEGTKAVDHYSQNTKKGISRQVKAGIVFPPSVAEKFLRRFDTSVIMVTHTAPVFMAAVMEYICMEILESAAILAKENRRIRITVSDIESAVKNDTELARVFINLNIKFLGGSVPQWIHPSLIKKSAKGDSRSIKIREKLSDKKARSGTLALKDIKRFQKMGNTLIFARQPFEKFVRQIINEHKTNVKISKNVFSIIQYVVEDYLVNFFADANAAAIHAGRVKLMIQDIDFTRNQREGNRVLGKITENKIPIVLNKPGFAFSDEKNFTTQEATSVEVNNTVDTKPVESDVTKPVESDVTKPRGLKLDVDDLDELLEEDVYQPRLGNISENEPVV
jgi:histone H2A